MQFLIYFLCKDEKISLPIPIIYFSSFMGDGVNDCLVIQNLCADGHFQVFSSVTITHFISHLFLNRLIKAPVNWPT